MIWYENDYWTTLTTLVDVGHKKQPKEVNFHRYKILMWFVCVGQPLGILENQVLFLYFCHRKSWV